MKSGMVEKEGFAALVLRLRSAGISNIDLLTAVEQTPRSQFVPPTLSQEAYSSRTVPIDCGAFMEGADLAVRLLAALQVKPGHRVLEIGTGSGFTAAVIGRIAERVLTVDRYKTLTVAAQARVDALGMRNVIVRQADGSNGMPGEGTFDRIFVTTAFTVLPRFYAEQLTHGGSMVAPLIGDDETCMMVRLTKTGSRFEREDLFTVPFLPIIPQMAAAL
ncbi:protein-L-isoaspartate O-methyltransferase [Rhizobium sp. Leaf306]|uniref:protein-L-isoaspartate(D-aspartate) O-methyltransferase n=1 Tax=Rhizobium/Agrobacterium group TaxID=227290 RepID=UPI000714B2FA|nr:MULTISPECIES: protein-L-isoaspartate(D-aspartate) O-methyltransferase [unclassified Rhizobium]RYE70228.1 MAG: protein-L-isoaspartate(D-aspartate) O-methyltransferase [Rhizobiaceae bacterium]KQQ37250.1 protein-L-isoaspartate O-methyltransferase [Rhizobium sp. Leaf306]KQQ72301.1 protein-L-isoaspartate O-methyltransferase [Rhizobium sp. Leaf321]MBD8663364.1 protein-L-isoaspartate(D-aspartate) O-methyltransferase [Rhizobium sp. CFBP 8752]SEH24869.1 protein-L-isoaspartate(D-aspartate) O-methyltr